MNDDGDSKRPLRSLTEKSSAPGPIDERMAEPEDTGRRPNQVITWPVAFIVAVLIVALTAVYMMSRWPEFECKRNGGVWYGETADPDFPDNFCQGGNE